MTQMLVPTSAPGQEIWNLIKEMEKVLIGAPEGHVLMATLVIALTIQSPNMTPEQLVAGVRGASEWMVLFTAGLNDPTPKGTLN